MPNKLDRYDIKDLRKRLKMSQQQLADKLGVAKDTVSRWERGEQRASQLAQRQLDRLHRKCQNRSWDKERRKEIEGQNAASL